tara:strand:+ start:4833 stop:5249 length:417 start_codon:yes stop_codon:yes gene_type:complete
MPGRLPKFGNVTSTEAKEALDGFTLIKDIELKNLVQGDNVKYAVDGVLKGGGLVKTVKYPDYFALKNRYKSISWCVQLAEPTLQVWVKTQETETKEIEEKKKVWLLYKAGKLMQIPKDFDEMTKIYEYYKAGKLVAKK